MNMISTDILGTLYTPGTYDAEGNAIDAPAALTGYHVNATHPVADWAAFKVAPVAPSRVFGGGDTHFYTFADAAEFEAYLDTADMGVPAAPEPVPQEVTMRQARLALLGAGLLAGVDAAIASLPEPDKSAALIEWEYAAVVQRNSGLVPAMGTALGMTEAQLDALFVTAAAL